jgi:hypothetical protein
LSWVGLGRVWLSLNYRSFMFGKLPPPACPGLCYNSTITYECTDAFIPNCLCSTRNSCGFHPNLSIISTKDWKRMQMVGTKGMGLIISQVEQRTIFVPLRSEAVIAADSPFEALWEQSVTWSADASDARAKCVKSTPIGPSAVKPAVFSRNPSTRSSFSRCLTA